jgi:hypothetical protein
MNTWVRCSVLPGLPGPRCSPRAPSVGRRLAFALGSGGILAVLSVGLIVSVTQAFR